MEVNMYTVVIADDEDIIREGFKKHIPWKELGFHVVGDFSDGLYVIDFLKENKADLVFTDLKMSQKTGIDIAKFIYENKLSTKVCVISGHKEFELARSAIKYNVEYFLTKPTIIEEAVDAIKKIRLQLDEDYTLQKQRSEYNELLENSRQQFFLDMFMGNFHDKQEIAEKAKVLKLDEEESLYCPFWIKVKNYEAYIQEHWPYGKECFFTAVCNFINFSDNKYRLQKLMILSGEILLMISNTEPITPALFAENVKKDLIKIQQNMNRLLAVDIQFQIGRIFSNLFDLIDYLSIPIWSETDQTQHAAYSLNGNRLNAMLNEKHKNILLAIIIGQKDQLENNFGSIVKIFSSAALPDAKAYCQNFFTVIFDKLSSISGKKIYELFHPTLTAVLSDSNTPQLLADMNELLKELFAYIQNGDFSENPIIEKAKAYINDHFNEDISLQQVADYVFFNSSYFSRFFKQHTGENFRDYLIKVRISKAEELLADDQYKIYEVGEKTGYQNSKYFMRQFKQITGITPAAYRANLQKGDSND